MLSLLTSLLRSACVLFLFLATGSLPMAQPLSAAEPVAEWKLMKALTPRHYVAAHTAKPLLIDGALTEDAWQSAPWTEDFQDIEGPRKPKPRFRTRAKMLWDEQYFYVAAEMEEPHLWATLTNHDAVIFHDPDFEVFIDPDGDTHDYYEFEMNALNTGWDLLLKKPYKDGGPALNEWEIPGLKTAVRLDGTLNNPSDRDRGWSVEIAFPWNVLRELARRPAPPNEGEQWRVSFSRVEWMVNIVDGRYQKVPGTKEDNWVWSPQGIIDMHRPERWGYVQFTRDASGQSGKFKPDASARARDVLQEIYYTQKDFQKKNRRYAATLAELNLAPALDAGLAQPPTLQLTTAGYQATVGFKAGSTNIQRWHIRQDARIWTE
jgi:cellulose/xylan binding protein with CBM9 domain